VHISIKKWLKSTHRWKTSRIPKQSLEYEPVGKKGTFIPDEDMEKKVHLLGIGTGN